MKTSVPFHSRVRRTLVGVLSVSIVCGGAFAYAQSTSPAATNDTLIGSALNTLGNAVATLRAEVAVLQQSERVARATLTETGGIVTQTGAWISRVDHPAAGSYVVTFTPSVFSTAPTCVTTPNANKDVAPAIECYGASTSSIVCRATAAGAPVDTGIFLLCAGS